MLWADPQGAAWVFQMPCVNRLNYMPHTCTPVIQIFIFVIAMAYPGILFGGGLTNSVGSLWNSVEVWKWLAYSKSLRTSDPNNMKIT